MKAFHTDVYDKGLNNVKSSCNKIIITNGVPNVNDYGATVAMKVAEVSVSSGDFTISANGSGRKISHPAVQGSVTSTTDGSADLHIAYLDTTGSRVLIVTDEQTNQALYQGNPLTFPSLDFGFNGPA